MSITITEALAEIKTIGKRVAKKREGLQPYLWRQEQLKDPLENDGGSVEFIRRELQAIEDLEVAGGCRCLVSLSDSCLLADRFRCQG